MAQSFTHYRLFLASPSDVAEERNLIEAAINELNNTVCKSLNIKLDLVKWETDSYPSVGAYSQDVISTQINDYDFFVGIMWSKVGTPTPKSKSGTIEEFNIAYEKLKSGSDIKILFYFSNKAIPRNEIIPEQIIELNNFKTELEEKGVYYYQYSLLQEFQTSFKSHISQHLTDIISKKKEEANSPNITSESPSKEEAFRNYESEIYEDEGLGILDYLDIFKDSFYEAESSIVRLGNYMSELGGNISRRTEKVNSYNQMPFDTLREIRKEVDRAANDMLYYVERTNVEIPIFHEHYYRGMEALSSALTIQEEDGTANHADLAGLSESLRTNNDIYNNTISQIEFFKNQVSKMPRMTASMKIAKYKIDQTLSSLLLELKSTLSLSEEFSSRIDTLLESLD